MKLVKFALTSPLIAISVALCAALSSFGDGLQNILTVAKEQGVPTITGANVWNSYFDNLFDGVATVVNDNERWMTGNPSPTPGWTSISFPAACTTARSLYLKKYRLYQVQNTWGSNLKAPTGWNLYGKTTDDGEWELIDSPVITADSPDHWLYFDDPRYDFDSQKCKYPTANEKCYITLDVPVERQKRYVAIKFEPTKDYLTDHPERQSGQTWFFAVEELELYGDDVPPATLDRLLVMGNPGDYGAPNPAYGQMENLAAGKVHCEAPADWVEAEDGCARGKVSGWSLVSFGGADFRETRNTSGTGAVCEYDHVAGEFDQLVWQWDMEYKLTVAEAEGGSVVVPLDWVVAGAEVTLTAVPDAGKEFRSWTGGSASSLTEAQRTSPSITLAVTGPMMLQPVFGDLRYKWVGVPDGKGGLTLAGNWNVASHWADLDGDGIGDIPPNDGTATVLLPATNTTYTITLSGDYKNVDIKGIYILSTPVFSGSSGNAITISSGSLTLREGGIEMDDSRNPMGIKFACDLDIPVSQTWMNKCHPASNGNSVNNDALTFNKKLTIAEDAVVTVAGTTPFTISANSAADFKGKLRTNCITQFGATSLLTKATDGVFEMYPEDTPYPGQSGARLTADATSSSNRIVITAPVNLDWANATKVLKVQLQVATGIAGNAWNYEWAGPLSGAFPDKKLSFGNVMTASSQHRSHHPEKQRNWFSGDNSGLDTTGLPSICFPHGVFTMAHANALGTDNVLGVSIGGGDTGGYFAGVTATDGIAVNSQITLNAASLAVMLGMLDPGTATFAGSFMGNQLSQVFLHAVPNSTARFTGAFTMNNANNYSLEVTGGGTVALEGDNAQVNQKSLNARVGTTVLGHANAAGTKPITLGGTVPGEFTVRAVVDRTFSQAGTGWKDVKDIGPGSNTRTNYTYSVASLVTDGVTLEVGDSFLYVTDVADGSSGRIYTIVEQGRFVAEWLAYAPGFKVKVLGGNEYGGKTFMFAVGASKSTTTCGAGNAVLDSPVANPDAKVLAKNGVTIANDINVTDNKSTGVSAIGSADASTVTFSGAITLAKDVVFEAAEGSTVNVTGTIAAGDFNVGFAGLGTTVFAQGLNVAGKVIAVTLPVDGVPTEGALKYVLAKGLSGTPASVTLATADGSAVPGEWTARVVGSKLVFRNKAAGFGVIVR